MVLVHQGCTGPYITTTDPPDYLGDCVRQYSIFNKDKIYILTDRENVIHLKRYPQVIPVALEDYYSDKIAKLCSLYGHPEKDFWAASLLRFVYLENFMWENGLQHVCHFENDVLVYFNISDFRQTFNRLYENIAITPGGPTKNMTGFMYISNYRSLECMTDFFIDVLTELGEEGIRGKYDCDMVHEMSLMAAYRKEAGPYNMAYLPILPFGEFSWHFDKFNAIFDPASWGQLVGGSRTEGPGVKAPDHHIGQLLRANPHYSVVWRTKEGLKLPYFDYNNKLVRINNLHIHSKNLKAFMSRGQ